MTTARNVHERLAQRLEAAGRLALVTVVETRGSTPRGLGAALLLDATGGFSGSVGGGEFEAYCINNALRALEELKPALLRFRFNAGESGQACSGQAVALVEVLDKDAPAHRNYARALGQASEAAGVRLRWMIWRETDAGLDLSCGILPGSDALPDEMKAWRDRLAAEAGERRAPVSQAEGQWHGFVEPLLPAERLVVCGAGHVGAALATLCVQVGFRTLILDERAALLDAGRLPGLDALLHVPDYASPLPFTELGSESAIVIATASHPGDAEVLRQALRSQAGYIGMLGSQRKRAQIFSWLADEGVGPETLERVCCPIGLDIGAETPAEIAVSIVAELIAFRAACRGRPVLRADWRGKSFAPGAKGGD